jgi:hypothetical protein
MPPEPRVQPQPVLLQTGELREAEREAGVVAEGAEVPEVIGDALPLEEHRAERRCTRRDDRPGELLHRHRVGPRERHGGVPAHAPGERHALVERHRLEALLDALVLVAESLLQAKHALPHHREPEMAGLDGARVHRTHRDLVDTVARDAHEVVVVGRAGQVLRATTSRRRGCTPAGHAPCRSQGRPSAGSSGATPVRSNAARCMRPAAGKCSPRSG